MKKKRAVENTATSGNEKLAVLYERVSSKEQEQEGFSIDAQRELLRRYALQMGFRIIGEFTDVETAKKAGRKGFQEMVNLLRANAGCHLLVEKTDRLYRNLRDYVTIDEIGVAAIHFVKENEVLTPDSKSSEKFMHGIKVLMAKNYCENLSEETRKGMLEKARQGLWPSYAPLGYLNADGPNGKRTIKPDPTLAPAIARLFQRYATGNYSLKELAKIAPADGLRYRKSGGAVPKSTVNTILRNRIYTGDFDFDGVTYHGTYEPIISKELWSTVQDILDGRNAKKTRSVKEQFAFSGLVTCGHCGCAMVGEIKKGRYIYYHCTGYKGKCPEKYTREKVLEERFGQVLKGISFPDEVVDLVTRALRESHVDERAFREDAIAKLQAERQRVQTRIDTMYLDKLDGRINAEFFDRMAADFRVQQAEILREIQAHQAADQNYIEEGIKLLDLARCAHGLFENQSAREKRRLLDFVLSNSTWKGGELTAQYRQPFNLLADAALAAEIGTAGARAISGQNENWLLR
jgi:site-specific DNA recombinase